MIIFLLEYSRKLFWDIKIDIFVFMYGKLIYLSFKEFLIQKKIFIIALFLFLYRKLHFSLNLNIMSRLQQGRNPEFLLIWLQVLSVGEVEWSLFILKFVFNYSWTLNNTVKVHLMQIFFLINTVEYCKYIFSSDFLHIFFSLVLL